MTTRSGPRPRRRRAAPRRGSTPTDELAGTFVSRKTIEAMALRGTATEASIDAPPGGDDMTGARGGTPSGGGFGRYFAR